MSELIKVTCPNCKSLLSINRVPGIEDKLLTCPVCRFKSKVSVYMQGSMAQGGGGADEEPTQVNFGPAQEKDKQIGSLYISDQEFSLQMGRTLVGRLASTSHADMQIPTDDRYMSRSHAYITVRERNGQIEHLLEPANPKNPIKLNGKVLENGDIVVLNWGDKLVFGHTEVIFERPKYNEEGTILEY